MPFGMYVSNVTCTAYVNIILNCFQVHVGPVITESECTVGECSDSSMSVCSHVTLPVDLQGVNKC